MICPSSHRQGRFVVLIIVLLGSLLGGCSRSKVGLVDSQLARDSLKTVLESWKQGEDFKAFQKTTPSITVQDMDWKLGCRLVDYEIIGEGRFDDLNLLCPVNLKLIEPDGKEVTKNVTYMIGTDPRITVFREIKM